MIKIINNNSNKVERVKCNQCLSLIEYSCDELVVKRNTGVAYGCINDTTTAYLECPNCYKRIIVRQNGTAHFKL